MDGIWWTQALVLSDDVRAAKCGRAFCNAFETVFDHHLARALYSAGVPLARYKLFLQASIERWHGRSWNERDEIRLVDFAFNHSLLTEQRFYPPALHRALEYFKTIPPEHEMIRRGGDNAPPSLDSGGSLSVDRVP